nr:DUF975 family protein [Lachnospiraceae bacterium]
NYVLCEYPDYSPTQCIDASKAMMKGRRWELFVLSLSFIPWILLVCVTLGIAIIYVGPYMTLTFTNYYHRIKGGFVGNNTYNNNGGYGQPVDPYGQPQAPYGQTQAPYGQPYGQPQAPVAPAPEQFVQNTADAFANTVDQAATESQQALDQASHDMMTNFDDYTDKGGSNEQ